MMQDLQTSPNLLEAPPDALSVGELATQIKCVLEREPTLDGVLVRGEISNFKAHGSGHLYFSLKDSDAQIRCCLWRGCVPNLRFRPANGHRVVARGRVEFYGVRGEVSFIVEELHFDGRGALFEAFEQLKQDLQAEGLFDESRKRPLPIFPRRIGLITSPTGAVAHDVLSVLRRRWPVASILLIPAAVQGFSAAPDLCRALSWASLLDDLDVLIIARGGGSTEDLWCFNDEDLARQASQFPVPVVSAIGHETDFTILDFVADLRAPTPSVAAEMVAPDIDDVQATVDSFKARMFHAVAGEVRSARGRLELLRGRRALQSPGEHVRLLRERVDGLHGRAREAARRRVKIEGQALDGLRAQLRALDPQRVLERGYALLSDEPGGAVVTSTQSVEPGQLLRVRLHDGVFLVRVESET